MGQAFTFPAGSVAGNFTAQPTTNTGGSSDDSNTGLIVALAILIPLVIIVVVVVIVVLIIKKKKQRQNGSKADKKTLKGFEEQDATEKAYKDHDHMPNPVVVYHEDPNNHSSRPINQDQSATAAMPQFQEVKENEEPNPDHNEEQRDEVAVNLELQAGGDRI